MPDRPFAATLRKRANEAVRAGGEVSLSAEEAFAIVRALDAAAKGFRVRRGDVPLGFQSFRTAFAALDRLAGREGT